MKIFPNKNNREILRYKIGGVGLSFDVKHPEIIERIKLHYKDYVSTEKSNVYVDVKYADFQKPCIKSPLFETMSWKLTIKKGNYLLYFPIRNKPSLAMFNSRLNKVKFYTMDSSGQILLYLFPGILFGLILPQNNAVILHACGVLNGKKAYCFIAHSGGGKSTIAKLALKKGFRVLNDDRVIVCKEKNLFKIYGNPWHGEVKNTLNKSSFIKELYFLKKSKFNKIKPMNKREAVVELLKNNLCIPVNKETMEERFNICSDLAENLKCYRLSFKPNGFIWRFLSGQAK